LPSFSRTDHSMLEGGRLTAQVLINWRHSGFNVDSSVHIPPGSSKTREALSQYIARPPLSLKKISTEENGEAAMVYYTSVNEFFKGKIESFPVARFLWELTQHIPPRGSQYIRRYGLYAALRRSSQEGQLLWYLLCVAEDERQSCLKLRCILPRTPDSDHIRPLA